MYSLVEIFDEVQRFLLLPHNRHCEEHIHCNTSKAALAVVLFDEDLIAVVELERLISKLLDSFLDLRLLYQLALEHRTEEFDWHRTMPVQHHHAFKDIVVKQMVTRLGLPISITRFVCNSDDMALAKAAGMRPRYLHCQVVLAAFKGGLCVFGLRCFQIEALREWDRFITPFLERVVRQYLNSLRKLVPNICITHFFHDKP